MDKAISRLEAFSFDMVGIKPGEKVTFIFDSTITATVIDNKKISYNGKEYSLSALAKELNGYICAGTHYFTYNGIKLSDLRNRS